jgi:hypothetical protein
LWLHKRKAKAGPSLRLKNGYSQDDTLNFWEIEEKPRRAASVGDAARLGFG